MFFKKKKKKKKKLLVLFILLQLFNKNKNVGRYVTNYIFVYKPRSEMKRVLQKHLKFIFPILLVIL